MKSIFATHPHGAKIKNRSGQRFGRLTLIRYERRQYGDRPPFTVWLCRCSCGRLVYKRQWSLAKQKTAHPKSCGEC